MFLGNEPEIIKKVHVWCIPGGIVEAVCLEMSKREMVGNSHRGSKGPNGVMASQDTVRILAWSWNNRESQWNVLRRK